MKINWLNLITYFILISVGVAFWYFIIKAMYSSIDWIIFNL